MTPERVNFARRLREQAARSEDILRELLRGSRFHAAKFRRQFLSIVAPSTSIAMRPSRSSNSMVCSMSGFHDARRTEFLERVGLRVVRFANEEVCSALDAALAAHSRSLETAFRETLATPPPSE